MELVVIEEYINYTHFIPQLKFSPSLREYYLGICPRDALVELLEFQLANGWEMKEDEHCVNLTNGKIQIILDDSRLAAFLHNVLNGWTYVCLKYKEI